MIDQEKLIHAWIKLNKAKEDSKEYEENFWAHSQLGDYVRNDPELAWQIILKIFEADQSEVILGMLAAGDIENLLSKYGPDFIERVEEIAAKDPVFKYMLQGVWKLTMTDEVWERLQRASGLLRD